MHSKAGIKFKPSDFSKIFDVRYFKIMLDRNVFDFTLMIFAIVKVKNFSFLPLGHKSKQL